MGIKHPKRWTLNEYRENWNELDNMYFNAKEFCYVCGCDELTYEKRDIAVCDDCGETIYFEPHRKEDIGNGNDNNL